MSDTRWNTIFDILIEIISESQMCDTRWNAIFDILIEIYPKVK